MQINLFNGGLSTRLLPHLIQANEAVKCENVDTSKGSLVPLKGFQDLNREVASNIYKFNGIWIDTDENRDYVEYQEKLFYSNGVGRPQWSPDGVRFFNVGIDGPTAAPVLKGLNITSLSQIEVFAEPFQFKGYESETLNFPYVTKFPYPGDNSFKIYKLTLRGVTGGGGWFPGTWDLRLLFKHPTLACYARVDLKAFSVANDVTDIPVLSSTLQCLGYKSVLGKENYNSFLLLEEELFTGNGQRVYEMVGVEPGTKMPYAFLPEVGQEYNYVAFWRDSSDRVSIEYFSQTFTEEDTQNKLLYGLKLKKQSGYSLILFRDGFKVKLLEDDNYYYDVETTTQESLDSYLSAADRVQYCYTYYSTTTGSESAPSPASTLAVESDTGAVAIGLISSSDPQVDQIRIYRFGANYTDFVLLTVVENQTQTFTDSTPLASLSADPIPTLFNLPAPTGLKFLISSNAMLFGALDDKLYYSNVGDPFFWESFSFIDFENTITGIGATPNGLLVFTKDKTFIVTGNSPSTLSKYLLSPAIGCVLHKSIRAMANTLVWLSKDGLYASSGGSLHSLSREKLGDFDFKNPICSEVKGEIYFLSCQFGTLIMDLRFGLAFVTLKERFKDLHVSESDVFGCSNSNRLVKLFKDDSLLEVDYLSPAYSDGSTSTAKVYTEVNVYAQGSLALTIYIDGKEVSTTKLAEGYNSVKLPQGSTRGYFIQFGVKGAGSLLELEYKVEGRQNG